MDDDQIARRGTSPPSTPHAVNMSHDPLTQKSAYTSDELKKIGKQCASRLPPASAVQAMLAYEMQRDTELEQLFHNQLFRLTRAEKQSSDKDLKIEQLEARIADLEAKSQNDNLNARLATSQTRMLSQAEKLKGCCADIEKLTAQIARISSAVAGVNSHEMKLARDSHESAAKTPVSDQTVTKKELDRLDSDLEVIFKDHNSFMQEQVGFNIRLTDCEDRVGDVEGRLIAVEAMRKASSPNLKSSAPSRLSESHWA